MFANGIVSSRTIPALTGAISRWKHGNWIQLVTIGDFSSAKDVKSQNRSYKITHTPSIAISSATTVVFWSGIAGIVRHQQDLHKGPWRNVGKSWKISVYPNHRQPICCWMGETWRTPRLYSIYVSTNLWWTSHAGPWRPHDPYHLPMGTNPQLGHENTCKKKQCRQQSTQHNLSKSQSPYQHVNSLMLTPAPHAHPAVSCLPGRRRWVLPFHGIGRSATRPGQKAKAKLSPGPFQVL